MSPEDRIRLRTIVAAWSDERGQEEALALAERHRHLLPRRITNAQLGGLQGVVQAATHLKQVREFTKHQGKRAAAAGRLDVAGYWEELEKTLDRLEEEAERLAVKAGITLDAPQSKKKTSPKPLASLALWLIYELVQHLVAHSLYLGMKDRGDSKAE